jgi:hypothetical protein
MTVYTPFNTDFVKNRKSELSAERPVAHLTEARIVVPIQAVPNQFAIYSVEESSVRVTSHPTQVLWTAFGRTSLVALLTVLSWGTLPSSVQADLTSQQSSLVMALQAESFVIGQPRPKTKPAPAAPKVEEPAEMLELKRDKEALPEGYQVPPVALPEISIVKELPIPKKEDKAAWKTHTAKYAEYSKVLVKGAFSNQKQEMDALRYGITYNLNRMTQRSLLFPSDEDRTAVIESEAVQPKPPESLVTIRDKILADLRTTNNSAGNFQIRDAFIDILLEEAPKLLDNHLYVRYEIGYLLSALINREEDKSRGLPEEPCFRATKPLLSLVNDEKMNFECKIYPIKGLTRICSHKNCKAEDRFVIIEALVKQLEAAKTIYFWYGLTIARCMGELPDPLSRGKEPVVAEVLLKVLKDPAYPDRVRVEAAHALGQIPLETFKRNDEIPVEVLRLAYDLVQAYEKDPQKPHWRGNFMWLYLTFRAEGKKEEADKKKGLINQSVRTGTSSVVNEAYQHFLPLVHNVIGVKGSTPIPEQLRKIKTWLDSKGKNGVATPVAADRR